MRQSFFVALVGLVAFSFGSTLLPTRAAAAEQDGFQLTEDEKKALQKKQIALVCRYNGSFNRAINQIIASIEGPIEVVPHPIAESQGVCLWLKSVSEARVKAEAEVKASDF